VKRPMRAVEVWYITGVKYRPFARQHLAGRDPSLTNDVRADN
jgi:hypothetical protein